MKAILFDILLLLLAALTPVVSLIFGFYVHDPQWFERSGSITVLLAAWTEYRQLYRAENEKQKTRFDQIRRSQSLPGTRSRLDGIIADIGLFLMGIGTIIWGYGTPLLNLFIK